MTHDPGKPSDPQTPSASAVRHDVEVLSELRTLRRSLRAGLELNAKEHASTGARIEQSVKDSAGAVARLEQSIKETAGVTARIEQSTRDTAASIARAEQSAKEAASAVSRLAQNADEATGGIDRLEQSTRDIGSALQQTVLAVTRVETSAQARHETLAALRDTLGRFQGSTAASLSKIESHVMDVLPAQLDKNTEEIRTFRQEVSDTSGQVVTSIQGSEARILQKLQEQVTEATSKISEETKKHIEAKAAKNAALNEETISKLKEEIKTLRKNLEAARQKLGGATDPISDMNSADSHALKIEKLLDSKVSFNSAGVEFRGHPRAFRHMISSIIIAIYWLSPILSVGALAYGGYLIYERLVVQNIDRSLEEHSKQKSAIQAKFEECQEGLLNEKINANKARTELGQCQVLLKQALPIPKPIPKPIPRPRSNPAPPGAYSIEGTVRVAPLPTPTAATK